jgi:hypothetical protein
MGNKCRLLPWEETMTSVFNLVAKYRTIFASENANSATTLNTKKSKLGGLEMQIALAMKSKFNYRLRRKRMSLELAHFLGVDQSINSFS